jgi:glycosyltransferase involved in cell wall biosynthesis
MKKQPLTSVVIPAYNAERFIERTLRSVCRQSFRNLEIIVVDDGSTDNTRVIAESAASTDDRVRVVSVPHGGVAHARNSGIGEATGEFVAFLDADDLWHPTKIELQVAAMSGEHGEHQPAAVYALSRVIDTDDRIKRNGSGFVLNGYSFARHLYARPIGNGSSILVRRETALAVGGFDAKWAARGIGGCEDLDFELKIAAKYPINAVGLYLVGYREYPGNMSSNTLAMALGAVSTIGHHIESCPELPDWAARSARASVLEYALENLITGRHWTLLLEELARLMRMDFGRTLQFAAAGAKRKLGALLDSGDRSFFYDLSPDFIGKGGQARDQKIRQARDQKIIDRLETVDAVLATRVAQSFEAFGNYVQISSRNLESSRSRQSASGHW